MLSKEDYFSPLTEKRNSLTAVSNEILPMESF